MFCVSGAIFAASNAAIMLVQLGDEAGAVLEMQRIARRAPGSADMRAALAALYWSQVRQLSRDPGLRSWAEVRQAG